MARLPSDYSQKELLREKKSDNRMLYKALDCVSARKPSDVRCEISLPSCCTNLHTI